MLHKAFPGAYPSNVDHTIGPPTDGRIANQVLCSTESLSANISNGGGLGMATGPSESPTTGR